MQKSLFWAALVGLVGTAAYLDARGVTALVGAALAADAKGLAPPPSVIYVAEPAPRATAMVSNPFDSSYVPAIVKSEPTASTDPRDAAPCEGYAVRVIAFAEDPRVSLASLWDTRDSRSFVSRRGSDVDGQSVAFIGRDRVWLTRGSSLCQIAMYAPPPATPPAQAGHLPAKPEIKKPIDPALLKGIERRGERDYAIDRSVLDRVLDDPTELMKLAQTVPVKVDGRMIGVALKGVRPDSLLSVVGLKDGDTLQKVNGYELTSVEKIMEAYAHLREMPHLTMTITRGGAPMTFDYAIR